MFLVLYFEKHQCYCVLELFAKLKSTNWTVSIFCCYICNFIMLQETIFFFYDSFENFSPLKWYCLFYICKNNIKVFWLLKCKCSSLFYYKRNKHFVQYESMFSMALAYVHVQLQLQAKYINISKLFFFGCGIFFCCCLFYYFSSWENKRKRNEIKLHITMTTRRTMIKMVGQQNDKMQFPFFFLSLSIFVIAMA